MVETGSGLVPERAVQPAQTRRKTWRWRLPPRTPQPEITHVPGEGQRVRDAMATRSCRHIMRQRVTSADPDLPTISEWCCYSRRPDRWMWAVSYTHLTLPTKRIV